MAKSKKRSQQIVIGYCALCHKEFRWGTPFDFAQIQGKPKAVCKGGCGD